MKRLLAVLVALVSLQGWAAPALLALTSVNAKAETRLPACCKRDGKHRCAMLAAATAQRQQPSPGQPILSSGGLCPYYPATQPPAILASSDAFLADVALTSPFLPAVSQRRGLRASAPLLAATRTVHRLRGPPVVAQTL